MGLYVCRAPTLTPSSSRADPFAYKWAALTRVVAPRAREPCLDRAGAGGSIEWLWKNFDKSGYKMYFAKHPDVHTKGFMAANLLGGWFQRCECLHKYAFSCMMINGKEGGPLVIEGFWIYRGQEVPEDAVGVPDHDVYEFSEVDLNNPEHVKKVEGYIAWDCKDCVDGKDFK